MKALHCEFDGCQNDRAPHWPFCEACLKKLASHWFFFLDLENYSAEEKAEFIKKVRRCIKLYKNRVEDSGK